MPVQEGRKRRVWEQLRRWLEGVWTLARNTKAGVGGSGCAVGVLGLAGSALMVLVLLDGLRISGWEASYLYKLPLGAFLPLVPFLICWRYPGLSGLILAFMAALAVALLMAAALVVVGGAGRTFFGRAGRPPCAWAVASGGGSRAAGNGALDRSRVTRRRRRGPAPCPGR